MTDQQILNDFRKEFIQNHNKGEERFLRGLYIDELEQFLLSSLAKVHEQHAMEMAAIKSNQAQRELVLEAKVRKEEREKIKKHIAGFKFSRTRLKELGKPDGALRYNAIIQSVINSFSSLSQPVERDKEETHSTEEKKCECTNPYKLIYHKGLCKYREGTNICKHCGYLTSIGANAPYCDHLYYPENCQVCS